MEGERAPMVRAIERPTQVAMMQQPGVHGGPLDGVSGAGATAENAQAMLMGNCYSVACCPCAMLNMGCAPMITVQQGFVGVVVRFGKCDRLLPPGRHRFNIMSERVVPVNLKVRCIVVKPQELLTSDNLTIKIDAVCYYQIYDAKKATFAVDDFQFALTNLAQVTLRTVLGENTLAEIFAKRAKLNERLKELIDTASDPWGIKVGSVQIKSIEIEPDMQRAMAAKAEAGQVAEAKVIQARAQRDSSTILSEAAQMMEHHPSALKLQYFETLRIMATQGGNTTIIVPDQMGAMSALAARGVAGQR